MDNTDNIRVVVGPETIPDGLQRRLKSNNACNDGYCYLLWSEDETEATLVNQTCTPAGSATCQPQIHFYQHNGTTWSRSRQNTSLNHIYNLLPESDKPASWKAFVTQLDLAAKQGKLELRPVQRMQLYIDGIAVGPVMK